jgi:hypothetical protein
MEADLTKPGFRFSSPITYPGGDQKNQLAKHPRIL